MTTKYVNKNNDPIIQKYITKGGYMNYSGYYKELYEKLLEENAELKLTIKILKGEV